MEQLWVWIGITAQILPKANECTSHSCGAGWPRFGSSSINWSVARPPAPRRVAVIKSNSIDRRCRNTRWSSGVKSGELDWPHSVTTERAPESWKTKRCACSTGKDKLKVTTEQGCVLSVIHPDGAKSSWASSWVINTLAAREQRTEMSVQWNLDARCLATAAHPARQISRCALRWSSDAHSLTKGSAESTIASNLAKSVIVASWHLGAKMADGIKHTEISQAQWS